jgi:DNA primase large subunit
MIRQELRIDPKRRANVDYKRRQFATAEFVQQDYDHRLTFYTIPPTKEITLEEFEEWAIHRLKVLSELEACSFRNKGQEETASYMAPILEKYLPLHPNSTRSSALQDERKKDHYSHFILRLAFSTTEELRRRFSRLETMLFRLRFKDEIATERQAFIESLDFEWEKVSDDEKKQLAEQLEAATSIRNANEQGWFRVDWEKVPELVESRKVFLRKGKAYVPTKEQTSLVVAEFIRRLDAALEVSQNSIRTVLLHLH